MRCEMFKRKEANYCHGKVNEGWGNSKKLWQNLSKFGNTNRSTTIIADHTADDFANFFSQKIDDIRENTSNAVPPCIHHRSVITPECFAPVTKETIVKLLWESPSKTCNIDSVPSRIIKRQVDILVSFIMMLFNRSMIEGTFPEAFKNTTIIPLLKETRPDSLGLRNF